MRKPVITPFVFVAATLCAGFLFGWQAATAKLVSAHEIADLSAHQDVFYPPEGELSRQGLTPEAYKQLLIESAPRNRYSSVDNLWSTCPRLGPVRIPVLLVQFTDKMPVQPLSEFEDAFSGTDYLNGSGISVPEYFNRQSYGQLQLKFDVYNWTTMPNTYASYSQNNSTVFNLILDAFATFNPMVDFAQYDSDLDGRIDGAVIVYPDRSTIPPYGIWAQTRILAQYTSSIVDGKYLGNTAMVPSKGTQYNSVAGPFEITVTAHEFSHVLGLPDLYANGPSGQLNNGPMYQMSMMIYQDYMSSTNHSVYKPINLDVWSRYFLGWIDPLLLTTDSPKYHELRCVNYYPDALILRNSHLGAREFFIVENQQRNLADPNNLDNGMFAHAPDTRGGIAIYHVDEAKIEADYPANMINWDRDGNYYDDTNYWPGLYFEENYVQQTTTVPDFYIGDFYFNRVESSGYDFGIFDETPRIQGAPSTLVDDNTTSTYTGVSNPHICLRALSEPNSFVMNTIALVGEETQAPYAPDPEGVYSSGFTLELVCATPGATIYYTTDGSEPDQSSAQYLGPIFMPEGITLVKAIARMPGFYLSEPYAGSFTVIGYLDEPQPSISSSGTNIELHWQAVPYATSYQVFAANRPQSAWLYIGTTESTTFTDNALDKRFYCVVAVFE